MPQVLFATLALVVATLFSLNQMRAEAFARAQMVNDEAEVMAAGVALQAMEYIGLQKFDTAEDDGVIDSPNELRAATAFPRGRACDVTPPVEGADCSHLDDFHEMAWNRVPFYAGPDTLWFEVSARVRYVTALQQPTSTKTYNKEVTVLVRNAAGQGAFLPTPVELARVFSFPR